MKSKQVRVGASLVTSIVFFVLIDRAIPVLSTDLPTALARMSASAFGAFAIGGFIARTDFILAAVDPEQPPTSFRFLDQSHDRDTITGAND